jgi:hypothetical protein
MATTTNFGWETPDDTDLVKDGALAMRTLGNSIDTSFVDLKGGTTGQVLSKASNTDLDFTWVAQDDSNAIQNAIIDAKGDLIVGTAADTPARLAVGTNGHVLTADSTEASGVKWAAVAAGGKVLQVVSAKITASASNSTNVMASTGITASITPSATSSKVLILITGAAQKSAANAGSRVNFDLVRGATSIFALNNIGYNNTAVEAYQMFAINYVDSPSTTSSTTYTLNFANGANAASVSVNLGGNESSIVLLEIGA